MITNFNSQFKVCRSCGHPYFKVENMYLFPKDADIRDGSAAIGYKEIISVIRCAKCGRLLDSVRNANFIKQ